MDNELEALSADIAQRMKNALDTQQQRIDAIIGRLNSADRDIRALAICDAIVVIAQLGDD
jgi:hypothetical protein